MTYAAQRPMFIMHRDQYLTPLPAEQSVPEVREIFPPSTVSVTRAATGLLLALAVPAGWLALRSARGRAPRRELSTHPALYAYMLVAGGLVTAGLGYALGKVEEQLRRANAMLSEISTRDELTGLHNARAFHGELPRMLSLAARSGLHLSLVLLDLDHFKRINDTLGHAAGDAALRAVGRALHSGRRREDLVARIGGEEIAIVLLGVDASGARVVAERALDAVRRVRIDEHAELSLTASAGVAEASPGETLEALFARADAALYAAKRAGRDRIEMAPPPTMHPLES